MAVFCLPSSFLREVKSLKFLVTPRSEFAGTFKVPGDKSISHRAVMFAAIAEGESRIQGFLEGEDCLATLQAFAAMGVQS